MGQTPVLYKRLLTYALWRHCKFPWSGKHMKRATEVKNSVEWEEKSDVNTWLTFSSLQADAFAVRAFAGAVESSDSGVVKRVEMQSVYRANGLFAAVHLLEKHTRDAFR